jgi:hypothetical protein
VIEGTLAGLRFVRNTMSFPRERADFIRPPANPGGDAGDGGDGGVLAAWTWQPVPEPELGPVPATLRPWEATRYRAYRAWLAGRTVGEVFGRAAAFLNVAASRAAPSSRAGALAGRQDLGSVPGK